MTTATFEQSGLPPSNASQGGLKPPRRFTLTADRPDNRAGDEENRVVPIVRLAFYGYIASIPFETVDFGVPVELTSITLGLLVLSLVFQIPLCLKKTPTAYALFFLYLLFFSIPVYVSTPRLYFEEARWQMTVLGQLVLMSWIAFNIMKNERVARGMLLTLAFACAALAVLQLFGIADHATESDKLQRVSAFGFHPNNLARILSLGLLAITGLAYATREQALKPRFLVWAVAVLLVFSIVQTGSRGGLLALGAGFLVFMLKEGAVSVKIRNVSLVLLGLIFLVALVFQSEMNRSRFESALEEGKFARRETIYPIALDMFLEKPLFGRGSKVAEYELGARLAHVEEDSKNPHNLILYVLISTGLLGSLPLFLGLGLTLLTAWRVRRTRRGVLPLAMLMTVLVANMSGVWLHNKMHWLVMAYVLSAPFAARAKRPPNSAARFE